MTPDENKANIARMNAEAAEAATRFPLLYAAIVRKGGLDPDPDWRKGERAAVIARWWYAKEHNLNPDTGQPMTEAELRVAHIRHQMAESDRRERAYQDSIPYVTPAPGAVIHVHTRKRGIRPRLK